MGACFDSRTYPGDLTHEALRKRFYDDCQDDLYENGHSYSGTIGMTGGAIDAFLPDEYATREAAEEAVDAKAEKWEGAVAACYRDPAGKRFWLVGACCSS